jgi:hypothetical protein
MIMWDSRTLWAEGTFGSVEEDLSVRPCTNTRRGSLIDVSVSALRLTLANLIVMVQILFSVDVQSNTST